MARIGRQKPVKEPEQNRVHHHRFYSRAQYEDATEQAKNFMRLFVIMWREKVYQHERAKKSLAEQEMKLKQNEASTSKPAVVPKPKPPIYLFAREEDMKKEVKELTFHVPL